MRAIFVAGLFALIALPSLTLSQVPERRSIVTNDMDYPGRDLQPLFDTDLAACERLCLNDPACMAFTFNARAGACFPKTGVADRVPFDGAISAIVVDTPPALRDLAKTRASELDFLTGTWRRRKIRRRSWASHIGAGNGRSRACSTPGGTGRHAANTKARWTG